MNTWDCTGMEKWQKWWHCPGISTPVTESDGTHALSYALHSLQYNELPSTQHTLTPTIKRLNERIEEMGAVIRRQIDRVHDAEARANIAELDSIRRTDLLNEALDRAETAEARVSAIKTDAQTLVFWLRKSFRNNPNTYLENEVYQIEMRINALGVSEE